MSELYPRAVEKLERWEFTGVFGRTFLKLFDLQMWCFGCDVKRGEGNLLLQSGFTRSRPLGEMGGSTHYEKIFDSDKSVHLWGFAVVISAGSIGSLCLRRYERVPTYLADKKIERDFWRPHELPKFKAPVSTIDIKRSQELLKICADQLLNYETKVAELVQPGYRRLCVETRRKERKTLKQTSLSNGWTELSMILSKSRSEGSTMPP